MLNVFLLIVGAGEMARLSLEHLGEAGAQLSAAPSKVPCTRTTGDGCAAVGRQVKSLAPGGESSAAVRMLEDRKMAHYLVLKVNGVRIAARAQHAVDAGPVRQRGGVPAFRGPLLAARAVDGVSFTVEPGQVFTIIGPNGAGKTTLFRLLMGILKATEGRLLIENLDAFEDRVAVKRLIGFLPDEPVFYSYLSGREILELSAAMHGLDVAATMGRISTLIARLRGHAA